MIRLGVLASGRGSNLQAIIDAIEKGNLQATIEVVISNKEKAHALVRAQQHRLTGVFVDPKETKENPNPKEAYDRKLLQVLTDHKVQLVVLAGYMRIVTPVLIKAFPGQIMNIHPSLLPAFPGLDVQQKALDWGVKIAGCTVHFVTEGVDEGPIILQAAVLVKEGDSTDDLSARILEQEHLLYPQAIQLFAEGRLRVEGRRVQITANS